MKVDRRKQRTQKLLREALIALILDKGYDAITVQDITDHANLGRATFYLHYHDKDELLLSLMQDILSEFVEQSSPFSESILNGSQDPGMLAFQHAEKNADLYRAILSGGGLAGVLTQYRQLTVAHVQSQLEELLPSDQIPIPIEIIGNFLFGAMNATVVWWLENDRPYPAEHMARMVHLLIKSAIQGAITSEELTTQADQNP